MSLLPLARLLRIPNVFTAFADIALGLCVAASLGPVAIGPFLFLFAASGCLYCSGMVWNDYFDLEEDRRSRPFRPLPSGKISTRTALLIAIGLSIAGLGFAFLAGESNPTPRQAPIVIAGILVASILLYDGWLKRTFIGPMAMGGCRFLNVLLGLSLIGDEISAPTRIHLAMVVGVYIVGVTWFARTEEGYSRSTSLRAASIVMLVAIVLALLVPARVPPDSATILYPYLLIAFGLAIASRAIRAIHQPTSVNVQAGVKRCILGLVVLDAILASAFIAEWGLLVVLLLPPGLILGKWVYST